MEVIEILILAIVQALTEFIPVSSSGHLILADEVFNLDSQLAVDVILHFGTLIALTVYYWSKLLDLLKNWRRPKEKQLITNIVISTIPAALAGFLFSDIFEDARMVSVVIVSLVSVGIIMILSDKIFSSIKKSTIDKLDEHDALFIGLAQVLALIPGVSRSGITILAGRARGMNNKDSADYAFLIAIPIIFGATLKIVLEGDTQTYISNNVGTVIIGVTVAAVVGWLVLKVLLRYLQNNSLALFGWYRIGLAVLALIIFLQG